MNRRFVIVVPLLSTFLAMSLSALAQEPRRGEPRGAMHHAHRRFDPLHFDRRLWALGRAYPHGCRWGRCGYWWWADGYWYFYDQPLNGPPTAVSEIAYDEQGNLVPVASGTAGTSRSATTSPSSDGASASTAATPGARSCGGCDRWRHGRRHYRRCAGPRTGRAGRRGGRRNDRRCRRDGSTSAARRILLVARRLLLPLSERCLVAANGPRYCGY